MRGYAHLQHQFVLFSQRNKSPLLIYGHINMKLAVFNEKRAEYQSRYV